MKLIKNEKINYLNEQLKIIKKRLEIINILLEIERQHKIIEDIIGQNLIRQENKKKSMLEILKENEHHLSPSVLGMHEWRKIEEEKLKEKDEGSNKVIEDKKIRPLKKLELKIST